MVSGYRFSVPNFHDVSDVAGYLRNPFLSIDDQMRLIDGIRRFAQERLFAACKRIRIPIDDIKDDVDRAITAYWSVKEAPDATAGDLQACELFNACVDALGRRRLDQVGRDTIILAFSKLDDDLKVLGRKFASGRQIGTAGRVRKAVQKVLKRTPSATAAEVWSNIGAKPPNGMTFYDNRLGKYIEHGDNKSTSYRTFANIVSKEKNPK